jgi:membrane fusion protein, copper/silver efflux system
MRMVPGAFVVCLLVAATASASEFASGVLDPYLRIQATLASDRTEGIGQQAAAIAAAAGQLGPNAAPIAQAAKELQGADTLAASRAAFGKLSDAIVSYARASGKPLEGVRLAYCPMEKQHWLQRDGTIANPYAGKKMLKCGEFKDGI